MVLLTASDPLAGAGDDRAAAHLDCELVRLLADFRSLVRRRNGIVGHEECQVGLALSTTSRLVADFVLVDGVVPDFFPSFHIQHQRHALLSQMKFQQTPKLVRTQILWVFATVAIAKSVAPRIG